MLQLTVQKHADADVYSVCGIVLSNQAIGVLKSQFHVVNLIRQCRTVAEIMGKVELRVWLSAEQAGSKVKQTRVTNETYRSARKGN